jgi:hypothetical protein
MESIAALSVACNVMQVIQFSLETVAVCKKIHEDKSPVPEAVFNTKALRMPLGILEKSLSSPSSSSVSAREQHLKDTASELVTLTKALEKELGKYEIVAGSSKASIMKRAARYNWSGKRRIDDLSRGLTGMQHTMQTSILVGLRDEINQLEWSADEILSKMDKSQQYFLAQLQKGHLQLDQLVQSSARLEDMVSKEAEDTRKRNEATTRAIVGTHTAIITSTTQEQLNLRAAQSASRSQVERFLQSLRFEGINARRNQIAQAQEKTFEWIFKEPNKLKTNAKWDSFSSWLKSEETVFWISGKAGSGKSTLMSFLLQHTKTKELLIERDPNTIIVSSFIWNAGSPLQRSQKGLLCTLLYELCTSDEHFCQRFIQSRNFDWKLSDTDWSTKELERTLRDALNSLARPVCMFIDGLDEIDRVDPAEPFHIMDFIELLQKASGIKLCVSSRPEPLFESRLIQYSHLRVQDLTEQDIRHYVQTFFSSLDAKTLGHDLYPIKASVVLDPDGPSISKLEDMVVRKANGVFLWVYLTISNIRNGVVEFDSWDMLLSRIEGLPSQLNDLYTNMWRRVNSDKKEFHQQAAFYLNLVLDYSHSFLLPHMMFASEHSIRRAILSGSGLQSDVDIYNHYRSFYRRVLARCGGLLEFSFGTLPRKHAEFVLRNTREGNHEELQQALDTMSSMVPQFSHRSAADYFKSTPEGLGILKHDPTTALERQFLTVQAVISTALVSRPVNMPPNGIQYSQWLYRVDQYPISERRAELLTSLINMIVATMNRRPEKRGRYSWLENILAWITKDLDCTKKVCNLLHSLGDSNLQNLMLELLLTRDSTVLYRKDLRYWFKEQGIDPTRLSPRYYISERLPSLIFSLLAIERWMTWYPHQNENNAALEMLQQFSKCEVNHDVRFLIAVGVDSQGLYPPPWLRFPRLSRFQTISDKRWKEDRDPEGLHMIVILTEMSIPHIFAQNRDRLRSVIDAFITEKNGATADELKWVYQLLDAKSSQPPKVIMLLHMIWKELNTVVEVFSKPVISKERSDSILEESELESFFTTNDLLNEVYEPLPSQTARLKGTKTRRKQLYDSYEHEILNAEQTVEYLVHHGHLPENVWEQGTALEILVHEEQIWRERTPLDEIDWSPVPEYDELLQCMDDILEQSRNKGDTKHSV